MPESFVNVTEGSGKKLHTFQRTIGANNVEDEYILHGEPALASYTITNAAGATSVATANSHILQIMAGSSLRVRIRRIELHQSNVATTGALAAFQLLRLTTAGTGGTTITPLALDPGEGSAGCTAMTLPTVKGTEGTAIVQAQPYFIQTVGAASVVPNPVLVWDFDRLRSKPLVISAGTTNGVCIKTLNAVAAATVWINVWLDETSF